MDKPKCSLPGGGTPDVDIRKPEHGVFFGDTTSRRQSTQYPIRRTIMFLVTLLLVVLRWTLPDPRSVWRFDASIHDDGIDTRQVEKPNFILIMTDDQDLHMNSIQYQPSVQKEFVEQGTFFSKHYCTIAICCPSRVSYLTGKAAHKYVEALKPD